MPLANAHYPSANPEWLAAGQPSGLYRSNMRRLDAVATNVAQTSGVAVAAGIALMAGDVVRNISFKSVGAANTPTNYFFALYSADATPVLLGQTADQLTAAWAANTVKTLALASRVTVPYHGWYYAVVSQTATGAATLAGINLGHAASSQGIISGSAEKLLAATFGSALTGTAPATLTSPAAVVGVPLAVVS